MEIFGNITVPVTMLLKFSDAYINKNATRANNTFLCQLKYFSWMLYYLNYFKLKNIFQRIKMNAEEILQDLPKDNAQDAAIRQQDAKRENTISHSCWWWQRTISRK